MLYSKGKKFTGVAVLALMGIAAYYYGVSYATSVKLYPGDQLEERNCRDCGGTGQNPAQALDMPELGDKCILCAGSGTIEVIVPGPRRPTRVRGGVVDQRRYLSSTEPFEFAAVALTARPHPAAISKAKVTFTPPQGEAIEVRTNGAGCFSWRLPPGKYNVKVHAPGYSKLAGVIEVPVLTVPIRLEKANVKAEPKSAAEAQSLYGLRFFAQLASDRQSPGSIRLRPGVPGGW